MSHPHFPRLQSSRDFTPQSGSPVSANDHCVVCVRCLTWSQGSDVVCPLDMSGSPTMMESFCVMSICVSVRAFRLNSRVIDDRFIQQYIFLLLTAIDQILFSDHCRFTSFPSFCFRIAKMIVELFFYIRVTGGYVATLLLRAEVRPSADAMHNAYRSRLYVNVGTFWFLNFHEIHYFPRNWHFENKFCSELMVNDLKLSRRTNKRISIFLL